MRVAEIGDNCIDVYERIGKKYPTDRRKLRNRHGIRNLSLPKRLQLLFRFRKQSWMIPSTTSGER